MRILKHKNKYYILGKSYYSSSHPILDFRVKNSFFTKGNTSFVHIFEDINSFQKFFSDANDVCEMIELKDFYV